MSEEPESPATPVTVDLLKVLRAKPIKVLPTDRLNAEKQFGVIRGYVAASGPERKAVANKEVGAIVQIHENTVSICNPFLQDNGLLVKEGQKNRPSEEAADYAQAYEWDTDKAAHQLAPVFRRAWFGAALIPKLMFRALTKDEAITFLANEAKAPKEYKPNLEMILEYLKTAGVINMEGSNITLGPTARGPVDNGLHALAASHAAGDPTIAGAALAVTSGPTSAGAGTTTTPTTARFSKNLDPLIVGLIDKLPDSSADAAWPLADRARWLNAAANIFDLMYTDPGPEGITVSLEGKTLSIKKGAGP